MNNATITPDKLEDLHEVVQKIYPLFNEYDLDLRDAITVVFTILVMGTSAVTEVPFFNLLTKAHNNLIDQIIDLEKGLVNE